MPLEPLFELLKAMQGKDPAFKGKVLAFKLGTHAGTGVNHVLVLFPRNTRSRDHENVRTAISNMLTKEALAPLFEQHAARSPSEKIAQFLSPEVLQRVVLEWTAEPGQHRHHERDQHENVLHLRMKTG